MSFPIPLVPAGPDIFTIDDAVDRIRAARDRMRTARAASPTPRRDRAERRFWNEAAGLFRRFFGSQWISVHTVDFSSKPYLIVHPEREIAEARRGGRSWWCDACSLGIAFGGFTWTDGEAHRLAIAAAHAHNAVRHPRRHRRSQHPRFEINALVESPEARS